MIRTLPLLLLAGCASDGWWSDLPVEDAGIQDIGVEHFALVVGKTALTGPANLYIYEADRLWYCPVTLSGFTVGFDVSAVGSGDRITTIDLDLSGADPDLVLSDVLGRYRGHQGGASVFIGGQAHALRNRSGVRLGIEALSFGIAAGWAFESLDMERDGDCWLERGDTGL